MRGLRQWQLNTDSPYSLPLAADARLSRTSYTNDQSWQVDLGKNDEPAVAFHTRYGGLAGLASLVPMWRVDTRVIYETQAYVQPPIITAFAPSYMVLTGQLLPDLKLTIDLWCMESTAFGGIFALENTGSTPITLHLDIFAHISDAGKNQRFGIITQKNGGHALHMGTLDRLNPVVAMENATSAISDGRAESPKISSQITIKSGKTRSIKFVHAGVTDITQSLKVAEFWLAQSWDKPIKSVIEAAEAVPDIRTGNKDWDLVIASAYHHVVQSIMKPTGAVPYPSFVSARNPSYGYSMRGDGSDHHRLWSGQDPTIAYLLTTPLATISPSLAQGILNNYLAVQRNDGWIDRRPGLAGQKQDELCPPVLARMAWNVFQTTQDSAFLEAVFAGLEKFFARWLEPDMDIDGDALPEWQSERQHGYLMFPSFAIDQGWSQGADISRIESPDLAAYMLSEAEHLIKIASQLNKTSAVKKLSALIEKLNTSLAEMWSEDGYTYRDRDTHLTAKSVSVLEKAPGDQPYEMDLQLSPANRLIVRVIGGIRHQPRIKFHIEGTNSDGKPVHETADTSDFVWQPGQGTYTTENGFSNISRIFCEGLSRVYRISVDSLDATRMDINSIMPLIADIPVKNAKSLAGSALKQSLFGCNNGITMVSKQDQNYDPSGENGGGGIWMYWFTLIAEGLLLHGYDKDVVAMLKNLLKTQSTILSRLHQFYEHYHDDEPSGYGLGGHIGGIAPLLLIQKAMGISVISPDTVWIDSAFAWGRSVTVYQHGVTVKRSTKGTRISFPGGHRVDLTGENPPQYITNPKPISQTQPQVHPRSPLLHDQTGGQSKSVNIKVEIDE